MTTFRRSARGWRVAAIAWSIAGCGEPARESEGEASTGVDASTGGSSSSSADASDASSTTDEAPPDACADACTDTESEAGVALCHSCRCRVAFDHWLPSTDELQCGSATPIVVYHADLSSPELALELAPIGAGSCANPSLLTGSCRQGSMLGQLQHGDVMMRWICRDPYLGVDGRVLYEDVALIGQNTRTGATCFWDDVDDVIHDDDLPPLDLVAASEAERARHEEVFDYVAGDVCTQCHDHDPFLYTPYLESTDWITVALDKGPYGMVGLDGETQPVAVEHLVSRDAAPCLACHRLGSNDTCDRFAADAMGLNKEAYYEQEVRMAAEPGSPHWKLAHWMPSASLEIVDYETWLATFGSARDHILGCCESPGEDVGDCRWEPVPSE